MKQTISAERTVTLLKVNVNIPLLEESRALRQSRGMYWQDDLLRRGLQCPLVMPEVNTSAFSQ